MKLLGMVCGEGCEIEGTLILQNQQKFIPSRY